MSSTVNKLTHGAASLFSPRYAPALLLASLESVREGVDAVRVTLPVFSDAREALNDVIQQIGALEDRLTGDT